MQQLFTSQSKSTSKKPKENAVAEENEDDEEEIQVHSIKPASLMKLLFSEPSVSTTEVKQPEKKDECIGTFEKLDDTIREEPDMVKPEESHASSEQPPKPLSIELIESVQVKQSDEINTIDEYSNQTDDMKCGLAAIEKIEPATIEVTPIINEPDAKQVPLLQEIPETQTIVDKHPETTKEFSSAEVVLEKVQEETSDQHVVINLSDESTAFIKIQDEVELVTCDQVVQNVIETLVDNITEEIVDKLADSIQPNEQVAETQIDEEKQTIPQTVVDRNQLEDEKTNEVTSQLETQEIVENNNQQIEEPAEMGKFIFEINEYKLYFSL
jgi:hypothetical protein